MTTKDFDKRWLALVEVVVQSCIYLALFFARRLCFMMNSLFAMFKVCLIIAFAIAGFIASRKEGSGLSDFSERHAGYNGLNALTGMIYVIHTYEGWEYTN